LGRTVAELENELSASELSEWQAFYRLEPFGDVRANWHAAVVAQIIAQAFSFGGGRPKVADFMWQSEGERRRAREAATIAWLDERSN